MSFRDLQAKKTLKPDRFNNSALLANDHPKKKRHRKFRLWLERLAKVAITLGGHSVIVAVLLIFFFLLWQVLPLLKSAEITQLARYHLPAVKTLGSADNVSRSYTTQSFLAIEEQGEIAAQFLPDGRILFIDTQSGETLKALQLDIPHGVHITGFSASDGASNLVVYGLSNGQAIIFKHQYLARYSGNQRQIIPDIVYPFGSSPVTIDPQGSALKKISSTINEQALAMAVLTEDRRLLLHHAFSDASRFSLTGNSLPFEPLLHELTADKEPVSPATQAIDMQLLRSDERIKFLFLSQNQRHLFLLTNNESNEDWLYFYHLKDPGQPQLLQSVRVGEPGNSVTAANLLTGGLSLLLGKQNGEISQWFPVNELETGLQMVEIRRFDKQNSAIVAIKPEMSRKGFYAIDEQGILGIYHTTADSNLLLQKISRQAVQNLAIAPRADYLMIQDDEDTFTFWSVSNEHPEISWQSLWQKVWYESYPEPDYVWQSSAATNDFEPKFSLMPLSLGTLKAAFYAMLFAIPLAVMGAIYTAYFMNARMRSIVKPTIEIMEALPTVIIGFLAGLWLAPLLDAHLPALLSLLILLPIGVLLVAWLVHLLAVTRLSGNPYLIKIPEGWEAFILIPVILLIIWLAMTLSPTLEQWFFGGDMQVWLSNEMGFKYEQRNAIIVGIAMGFAVIPTIFSITEDAVFNVPGHLTYGSMALGATRWQTLIRVVILTASPAIFSAVMIGFGRAIGETMIVLMATGNTPIMDFSIFQGMRTLSANIAIETPESEVASSHYRVLFLAALILFLFTFFFNTIAEIIRQRLRRNYSKL